MSCRRQRMWLSLYVDGRLDSERLPRLESHLGACEDCRRDLARLMVTQRALREERLVEPPVGLTEQVMSRVAVYEAQLASEAAERRQRAAARAAARAQAWRGVGARRVFVLTLLLVALVIWAQLAIPRVLEGVAARVEPNVLELLATPGPDAIAWSVWIAGGALALGVAMWVARADASEELRRALADRLPQLW